MGVGFHCGPEDDDHCDAQWAYSSFGEFRKKVAAAAGIELDEMEGYEASEHLREVRKTINDGEDRVPLDIEMTNNLPKGKSWDEIDDPIVPFLCHSDCEGILTPEECAKIAPRLKELIADWPEAIELNFPEEWQEIGYPAWKQWTEHDKKNGDLLVAGMEWAAENGYPLEFH